MPTESTQWRKFLQPVVTYLCKREKFLVIAETID